MALTITHPFVSIKPDGNDTTLIRPSNWNANHLVAGTLGADQLAGANAWTGLNVFQAGIRLTNNVAPADNTLSAGECALWFDPTNGSPKLMIKAKQANGTVVTGMVALT